MSLHIKARPPKRDCPERREILLAAENDRREQLATEKLHHAEASPSLNRRNAFLARRMRRQAQEKSQVEKNFPGEDLKKDPKPRHFSEARVLGGRRFVVIPTDPSDDRVIPLSSSSTVDTPPSLTYTKEMCLMDLVDSGLPGSSSLSPHKRTFTGSTADTCGSQPGPLHAASSTAQFHVATASRRSTAAAAAVPPLTLTSLHSAETLGGQNPTVVDRSQVPLLRHTHSATARLHHRESSLSNPGAIGRQVQTPTTQWPAAKFEEMAAASFVNYDEITPTTKKGYNQFVAVKRVETALSNCVDIASSSGSPDKYLVTSTEAASLRDEVVFFPVAIVKSIFERILYVYKMSGKPGPGTHLLTPQNTATRNPDLFWSLFVHFGSEGLISGFESMVAELM